MNTKTSRPAGTVQKVFIDLNGARQGMSISRSDRSLPVLLYLHGGMPDYFLERKYPSGLERFFTVVWWEQRGSGMSYRHRAPQHLVTMLATDLRQRVREVGVPVYFLHGVHDYTCSYALARTYFEELAAPVKGFYTFPNSAHSPIFEEPHRARRIICGDILNGSIALADDSLADGAVGIVHTA